MQTTSSSTVQQQLVLLAERFVPDKNAALRVVDCFALGATPACLNCCTAVLLLIDLLGFACRR